MRVNVYGVDVSNGLYKLFAVHYMPGKIYYWGFVTADLSLMDNKGDQVRALHDKKWFPELLTANSHSGDGG